MSHLDLSDLHARLTAAGAQVVIVDGAQGRAARMFQPVGYDLGCQASAWHHTASSGAVPDWDVQFLIDGLGDGWVIANAYVSIYGVIYLIASGPTYTEGRGGPLGIIPENGGNRVCFSTEIANRGNGIDPYEPAQVEAVRILAKVVNPWLAETQGWPDDPFGAGRMFAHWEWTPRKIDPYGPSPWGNEKWDMKQFRADARDAARPTGDTVQEFKQRIQKNGTDRITLSGVTQFGRPLGLPAEAKLLHLNITLLSPSGDGYITSKASSGSWDETSAGNFNGGATYTSLYPLVGVDGGGFSLGLGGIDDCACVIDIMGWS